MGDNRDREIDIHGGRRTPDEPSVAETLAKAQKIYQQQGALSPRQRQAKKRADAKVNQNAAPASLFDLVNFKD